MCNSFSKQRSWGFLRCIVFQPYSLLRFSRKRAGTILAPLIRSAQQLKIMETWGECPLGGGTCFVQKQPVGCCSSLCGQVPSCETCSPAWEPPGLTGFGDRGYWACGCRCWAEGSCCCLRGWVSSGVLKTWDMKSEKAQSGAKRHAVPNSHVSPVSLSEGRFYLEPASTWMRCCEELGKLLCVNK